LGSVIAASLGARVIERQFAIESRPDLPNQTVSLDAKQLKLHIEELRTIPMMLGVRSRLAAGTRGTKAASPRPANPRRPLLPKARLAARESAHKK